MKLESDPKLGSTYATRYGHVGPDILIFSKFNATEFGWINALRVWREDTKGFVKVAIYSDLDGYPGKRLTTGENELFAEGWNPVSVNPIKVIKDRTYWIALISSDNGPSASHSEGYVLIKDQSYEGFKFKAKSPAGLTHPEDGLCLMVYGYFDLEGHMVRQARA